MPRGTRARSSVVPARVCVKLWSRIRSGPRSTWTSQSTGYVAALRAEGWEIIEVPPAEDCPDAVFVEDTVVVYGELAVITRPGADERKPDVEGTTATLVSLSYRIARIEPRGTLDGGDVLKGTGVVWVGLSGRTNASGVQQLAELLGPLGARSSASRSPGRCI